MEAEKLKKKLKKYLHVFDKVCQDTDQRSLLDLLKTNAVNVTGQAPELKRCLILNKIIKGHIAMNALISPFCSKKSTSRAVKGSFLIINGSGLHTRPCTEIVKCAMKFKSEIRLVYRKKEIANAKSILGILMFAAPKGAEIIVEAIGVDAEQAVQSLVDLASKQFNIKH